MVILQGKRQMYCVLFFFVYEYEKLIIDKQQPA